MSEPRFTCDWKLDDKDSGWACTDAWKTECSNMFQFTNGDGPFSHSFTFCPYCGGIIREKADERSQIRRAPQSRAGKAW